MSPRRLRTIEDLGDLIGKTVLVRCDLNVPLEDGKVTDDLRIRASVPTLRELLEKGATLVVCSHLGRPKGKPVDSLRLDPVGEALAEALGQKVNKLDEVVGPTVQKAVLAAGVQNLFDNFPDKNIPANFNFGIFTYPRNAPFVFNGRYVYLRTGYAF